MLRQVRFFGFGGAFFVKYAQKTQLNFYIYKSKSFKISIEKRSEI